ncbi:MAG: hypothetical protein IPJ71_11825 [Bdellovibrionales bacterium]|nr:hypothetical protein [Bdellovibrionales bacterium]
MLRPIGGTARSLLNSLFTFSLLSLFTLMACDAIHSSRDGSTIILRGKPEDFCRTRIIDPIPEISQNERKMWLAKAYRLLRGGSGLRATDDVGALLSRTRRDLVHSLIDDVQFGDFVLDFNLYFLGFKRDRLRDDFGMLTQGPFDFSQAINSAIKTLQCGDYEALLQLNQKLFAPPLKPPLLPEGAPEEWKSLPPQDLREKIFAGIQSPLDQLIADIAADPLRSQLQNCKSLLDSLNQTVSYYFSLGAPLNLISLGPIEGWYTSLLNNCTPSNSIPFDFVQALQETKSKNEIFFSRLSAFQPENYSDRKLTAIRTFEMTDLNHKPINQFTGLRFSLVNSSTNYNRKRASFVLSRFFCDDLMPIGVEDGEFSTKHGHGSAPSCIACHHRLDPMAGFFKDMGLGFENFGQKSQITFDDGNVLDKSKYQNAWKATPSENREWNIGYIRSVKETWRNSYGVDLHDLFEIIKSAPEVKHCLVKRLFEYLVAENQVIDGSYLDFLTHQYAYTAQFNSSLAFKELVADIILGKSFLQTDLNPQECYDFTPGHQPGKSPPCRVNFLLQKNCAGCHQPNNLLGGLDVTRWAESSKEDPIPHFIHVDLAGKQFPSAITFARIIERLNSSEPERRMPLKQFMEPGDREALFRWSNEMLGGAK